MDSIEETNTIEPLIGKTMKAITVNQYKDELTLIGIDGTKYKFYHSQNCCQTVNIESIAGDLLDLVGSPIKMAEEVISTSHSPARDESNTWTFYKFATIKGYVDVRWVGSSNGFYSESVDFRVINPPA